jgi:ribosomal protein S27AE
MPVTSMRCPKCGTTMNQHGEKVVYDHTGRIDADFGGVLEEMHACPRCGYVTSRPAN